MIYEILQSAHQPSDSRWRHIFSLPISTCTFSAFGVSHVMPYKCTILTYLLTALGAAVAYTRIPLFPAPRIATFKVRPRDYIGRLRNLWSGRCKVLRGQMPPHFAALAAVLGRTWATSKVADWQWLMVKHYSRVDDVNAFCLPTGACRVYKSSSACLLRRARTGWAYVGILRGYWLSIAGVCVTLAHTPSRYCSSYTVSSRIWALGALFTWVGCDSFAELLKTTDLAWAIDFPLCQL